MQNEVLRFVQNEDHDNKFLLHIRARINHAIEIIKERHEHTAHGFVLMAHDDREAYAHASHTFELLQMLTEGHNLATQNLLREQAHHAVSVCLFEDACSTLALLCHTSASLRRMEDVSLRCAPSKGCCALQLDRGSLAMFFF